MFKVLTLTLTLTLVSAFRGAAKKICIHDFLEDKPKTHDGMNSEAASVAVKTSQMPWIFLLFFNLLGMYSSKPYSCTESFEQTAFSLLYQSAVTTNMLLRWSYIIAASQL